ncbi:MAG: arylsulfotransferase family protein [Solirubrobacteraceae bacterium]
MSKGAAFGASRRGAAEGAPRHRPLAATLAALALCLALCLAVASGASGAPFASFPTLEPLSVEIPVPDPPSSSPPQQEGYVMASPIQAFSRKGAFVGRPGPAIFEADGNLVWQLPLGEEVKIGTTAYKTVAMDLHTATYGGKRVLVWWQGHITPAGFGNGIWEIANEQYKTIATVAAPAGYELDFHDIAINANGMAYILANKLDSLNLSGCCGGPTHGTLYDQVLFEVNIATGKIVWQWDPLAHIPLRDSYAKVPAQGPWDPYHMNSISVGPAGNVTLSARNTWAAYWIVRAAKHNKAIFATLGGKASSFQLGPGVRFAWQHDVSQLPNEQLTVFDDEAAPTEGTQSRGLLLQLSFAHRTASVVHEYLLPKPELAGSQGSVQIESNGNVFVGWGQLPEFSEYSSSGQLLYEGTFTNADESYRAYRLPWIGLPSTQPSLAVVNGASGPEALASWNGATQVVSWQLLAGPSATELKPVGSPVPDTSFQTPFPTGSGGPYFAVEAIDKAGKVLGTSVAEQVSG